MDLLSAATDLYEQSPAAFTGARNARAKVASAEGDRDLAAQLRALPKPSASAWAVNRLATDSLRDEFTKLGAELRDAQSRADREELTPLLRQRKALVAKTVKEADALAAKSAVRLSPAAHREIEQTLKAALADEDGLAAAFSGRLVRPLESDGLEAVDLEAAVGGPGIASRSRSTGTRTGKRAPSPARAAAARKSADAARALKAARDADAALKKVERRAAALDSDRDALDRDAAALQAKFDDLETRTAELDVAEADLRRETKRARETALRAHRAEDAARR